MERTDNGYLLKRTETLLTENEKDAYMVRSGEIAVFIVPLTKGEPGRRIRLCTATEGTVVPSFKYRDMNYQNWCFLLQAEKDSELQLMSSGVTSVLKKRFAKRAEIGDLKEETFENSIVEYYKNESVKDNVFIERGKKQAPNVKAESLGMIHNVFGGDNSDVRGTDSAYRSVAYACGLLGEKMISEEDVAQICGENMTVPNVADAFGLICRDVVLEEKWYKKDCGILIGKMENENVVAVPKGFGYQVIHVETGQKEKVTSKIGNQIEPQCFSIARALPREKMEFRDLISFGWKEVGKSDLWAVILLGLAGTLIGVLLPTLNQKVYDDYIPLGDFNGLFQLCAVISSFMIGNLFFSIMKSLCEYRLESRAGYNIQNAVYHRVFRLPESFFHSYESADLAERLMSVGSLANSFIASALVSSITTVLSLLYLFRMFKYSAKLSWIAILMVAVYSLIVTPLSFAENRYNKTNMELNGEASSKLYQFINGVEKIRMAGVEDRAIYEYLTPFSKGQSIEIKKNRISTLRVVIAAVASTIFSMVFYYIMVKSKINITMGAFMGFNSAMGSFSGAIQDLVEKFIGISQMRPTYDRIKDVFRTACEDDSDKEKIDSLRGEISVHHVTFSYTEEQKPILDDFSLVIHPGEYLGIVGSSGCGKSTLLKLLLGFETSKTGQVCYDGHDLKSINKQSLRKNLGVVLQNGQLISGSIYENITIADPTATVDKVMKTIDAVGLRDDINQMPMGIHTMLDDNSNTISGGQQQRILIARAIIRDPKILIFDEATSALDNITQAAVSENLDKMNSTRIVVAHRLSTIKNCDRIIVMDKGNIAEEGNYSSLMEKHGLFYQLASRQIAE